MCRCCTVVTLSRQILWFCRHLDAGIRMPLTVTALEKKDLPE